MILGCMHFGKQGWGIGEAEAWALLDAVYAQGGRVFDTANFYAGGQSERILGGWARERGIQDSLCIMSKAGGADPQDASIRGLSAASLRRSVESSLCRLGVESLGVLTLHWPDPDTAVEETLDGVAALLEQGLIRGWALSNYYAAELVRMLERAKARALPPPRYSHVHLNLLEQHALQELIPESSQYGVTSLAWSPLCGGVLSSESLEGSLKFCDPASFWHRYRGKRHQQRREQLVALAQDADVPLLLLSFAWLDHWGVEPICGFQTPEQFEKYLSLDLRSVQRALIMAVTEVPDTAYPHDLLAFSGVARRRGCLIP